MTPLSRVLYEAMLSEVRKAADSIQRAADGATESNWENGTVQYLQLQLLRVNRHTVKAIEVLNAELIARKEAAPTSQINGEASP